MVSYRLFFLDNDNHIVAADSVDCRTDADAIAFARRSCQDHPAVEVWERARLVQRVSPVSDDRVPRDEPAPASL